MFHYTACFCTWQCCCYTNQNSRWRHPHSPRAKQQTQVFLWRGSTCALQTQPVCVSYRKPGWCKVQSRKHRSSEIYMMRGHINWEKSVRKSITVWGRGSYFQHLMVSIENTHYGYHDSVYEHLTHQRTGGVCLCVCVSLSLSSLLDCQCPLPSEGVPLWHDDHFLWLTPLFLFTTPLTPRCGLLPNFHRLHRLFNEWMNKYAMLKTACVTTFHTPTPVVVMFPLVLILMCEQHEDSWFLFLIWDNLLDVTFCSFSWQIR